MKSRKRSSTKILNADKNTKEAKPISVRRFILIYLGLMGAFFLLIGLKPIQNVVDLNGLYTDFITFSTAAVLSVAGITANYHGSLIQLPSITLDVKFGCNGLEAVMIYSVAILTFPSTWKKRALGIIAGFLVIQVINILRITGLAYSGVYYREIFDLVHTYLAQGVMIAVSLGVFLLYLFYINKDDQRGSFA